MARNTVNRFKHILHIPTVMFKVDSLFWNVILSWRTHPVSFVLVIFQNKSEAKFSTSQRLLQITDFGMSGIPLRKEWCMLSRNKSSFQIFWKLLEKHTCLHVYCRGFTCFTYLGFSDFPITSTISYPHGSFHLWKQTFSFRAGWGTVNTLNISFEWYSLGSGGCTCFVGTCFLFSYNFKIPHSLFCS